LDSRSGWKFYIVGVGTTYFKGTFMVQTWIEKGAAEPVIALGREEITVEPVVIEIVEEVKPNITANVTANVTE